MVGPKKVTQEVYDKFRSNMEKKYNYDEMSDEEKERFDSKIDEVAVVGDRAEESDKNDGTDDDEAEKGEFEDGHPHEHERDDDEYIR